MYWLFSRVQFEGVISRVTVELHAVNENQIILSAVPLPLHKPVQIWSTERESGSFPLYPSNSLPQIYTALVQSSPTGPFPNWHWLKDQTEIPAINARTADHLILIRFDEIIFLFGNFKG